MCANAQFSRIFLCDAVWPCERTLIAFVKIAGKTLLHKEFRGVFARGDVGFLENPMTWKAPLVCFHVSLTSG